MFKVKVGRLEHLCVWVPAGVLEPVSHGHRGGTALSSFSCRQNGTVKKTEGQESGYYFGFSFLSFSPFEYDGLFYLEFGNDF